MQEGLVTGQMERLIVEGPMLVQTGAVPGLPTVSVKIRDAIPEALSFTTMVKV
jgi:hypothetical protein